MTPEDWRSDLVAWSRDAHLDEAESEALNGLLGEIGPALAPPTREEREREAQRWAYLRRWPLEMRLGVLRILGDLKVLSALKRDDPEAYLALVAELRGDYA